MSLSKLLSDLEKDYLLKRRVVVSRLNDGVVVYEGIPNSGYYDVMNAAAYMRIDLTIKFIQDE